MARVGRSVIGWGPQIKARPERMAKNLNGSGAQGLSRLISLNARENLLALIDLIKPLQPVHQHRRCSSSQEG
jgi:hypothetical protein